MAKQIDKNKKIDSFVHEDASRRNIPPAEYQTMVEKNEKTPIQLTFERRNPDLDPQLVWRGKELLDRDPLTISAPPLYIQEKIVPKVLIDDLKNQSIVDKGNEIKQIDLFTAFNGLPSEDAKTEFYQHEQNWSNRMILGDSLQVMSSLSEREGLRGKVQCIFFDPPYGIKFNSNFQWSTTTRDTKDGKINQITREPEQVKAFRDTWREGIHSYLSYLRDRLLIAKELLHESGSIFLQIGDENMHRARLLMDEVFGENSHMSTIAFTKGAIGLSTSARLPTRLDYILWYKKSSDTVCKYRQLYEVKNTLGDPNFPWVILENGERLRKSNFKNGLPDDAKFGQDVSLTKPGPGSKYDVEYMGRTFNSGTRWWGTTKKQLERALKSGRIITIGNSLRHLRYLNESSLTAIGNLWDGFMGQSSPVYVVQTNTEIVKRCILMSTDPGDLVLDPTCGSGTSAFVSEEWGRRWITIDTSRVALALARGRMMGANFPYYLLVDSDEGQIKESELSISHVSKTPSNNCLRQGFVYERAPRVTFKSIANNEQIDVIYEKWHEMLQPILAQINSLLNTRYRVWDIPRKSDETWSKNLKTLHSEFWKTKLKCQSEIDKSIAINAEFEFLYDKPYQDKNKIRVSGPFTVESLSPHRTMIVGEDDSLIDPHQNPETVKHATDFDSMILDALRVAGVQQAQKKDRISFNTLVAWPGTYISGKANYKDAEGFNKTAGIFIGPEFGTVSRFDLVEAARECTEANFDVLISCAFNYDSLSNDFEKLGHLPLLKARMNADLHMQYDLKNSGKGNLFVVFGEPDIEIIKRKDNKIQVKIHGVDIFDPSTSEVRSDNSDNIACWFIDSDYNGKSFFIRQAYFLGQKDPYNQLKNSLKAEIDSDAWSALYSDISIPFIKPSTKRIAVKVINHLGDEVMKIYKVN